MKIISIACSKVGNELQEQVREKYLKGKDNIEWNCIVKCKSLSEISINESISEYVSANFFKADAIVFFCAMGIAVRSISKLLGHKSADPAILVVDETGKYCIPILSGHMGGANEFARNIASVIGAIPVITTATDCEEKFAIDEFARKNQLIISDWKLAKYISAGILEGRILNIRSDIEIVGNTPKEVMVVEKFDEKAEQCGKAIISNRIADSNANNILQLIPKNVVVGIGCRKNASCEKIENAIKEALCEAGILKESVFKIVSIDLKKNESGILELCSKWNLLFDTYSAEELNEVAGKFESSQFVKKITGVDNVCERSAALAGGKVIYRKKAFDEVTVALSIIEMRVTF